MADDFDYDDGAFIDMDDAWLYVEDEFDLADELAENQVPSPGYSGTNHEIDMEGYEFDLYGYSEDLEYGDDSYWDYGSYGKSYEAGEKRKRGPSKTESTPSKRRKSSKGDNLGQEFEPLLFRSSDERIKLFFRDPPLQREQPPLSFLGDWRKRFAEADGIVSHQKMPEAMKAAAESKSDETPEKAGRFNADHLEDVEGEEEWEDDEDEEEEEGEAGLAIDPDMLKAILKEKLGNAGLEGMDESAFMDTINKMLSGTGDADDAAGALANSLLGKVTSDTGDGALSGWLSGQGVNLEQDDDASSVATNEQETARHAAVPKQRPAHSPPDSAVELHKTTQMPLHDGSPTGSTKKRKMDVTAETAPRKKTKKVTFDVPPSSSSQTEQKDANSDHADLLTNEDPLMSESTMSEATKAKNTAAVQANRIQITGTVEAADGPSTTTSQQSGRKRKATSAEALNEKPVEKKTRNRELQDLGPLPSTPSPGGPARRTRNAKAKAGK
ncbi:hypothetical protein AC578_8744 [Pseudocercospora eumusae]|uniref:Uncharacterized protein n=1 Tax=Pseudocercospora eumusae TaxID=321146 RepID=A0A139H694_9PEZI|nr:hypothetical protein AC578_8744 [Pseudocercospora eumusae]